MYLKTKKNGGLRIYFSSQESSISNCVYEIKSLGRDFLTFEKVMEFKFILTM